MGLDLEVIRTKGNIDLKRLYAIRDAVESGFDWYLGDDASNRGNRFSELLARLSELTREEVVAANGSRPDLVEIGEDEFNGLLNIVKQSVGENSAGNSHLFLKYGKLPGDSVHSSCSWTLHDLLTGRSEDEFVVELNADDMTRLARKWRFSGIRLKALRYISYLRPDSTDRMVSDFLKDYGIPEGRFIYMEDLAYLSTAIRDIGLAAKGIRRGERLWLVTSY